VKRRTPPSQGENNYVRKKMTAVEEKGTFVKTSTQYNLFWKNCTELLHQFFPGEFDCSFMGNKSVALPVKCKWLKGKNSAEQLAVAKNIVSAAWSKGREQSKKLDPLICNLKRWAEDAASDRRTGHEKKYGNLCVVVAVVKRFSWLVGSFSFIQHLTIFFYHEKQPDRVCSIGINIGSTMAMITSLFSSKSSDPNARMRVSSPDKLLIDAYNPQELDIVATFALSKKQARTLAFAIDHLEKHRAFHEKSEEDAESDWQSHISKPAEELKKTRCKRLSRTACEATSHCRWFALTRGVRKRCHPREGEE